jgi:hypothetical protein
MNETPSIALPPESAEELTARLRAEGLANEKARAERIRRYNGPRQERPAEVKGRHKGTRRARKAAAR